jgi:hypothetical protein
MPEDVDTKEYPFVIDKAITNLFIWYVGDLFSNAMN